MHLNFILFSFVQKFSSPVFWKEFLHF